MAVFQVVLGCILLSLSLINWLRIKQLLRQQTVSSSSQVKQRVIKENMLTSLPCLSHLHPLDCLSSFFCWRNARIIMNCHFVSSTCRLISESLCFILITEWWYPGQINVSAVLYATVLDFRKHPLRIMLFLSATPALGAPARDQGSQAQHGPPAQYKPSHFLGDFSVQRLLSEHLQAGWTLGPAQVEKVFSAPPRSPKNHPQCKSRHHWCLWLLRWSILLGGSSSSPVGPDLKPKETVVTILNYTPNSKCPHKPCCLSWAVEEPSRSPDRALAWRCRHRAWGLSHPRHSFC